MKRLIFVLLAACTRWVPVVVPPPPTTYEVVRVIEIDLIEGEDLIEAFREVFFLCLV